MDYKVDDCHEFFRVLIRGNPQADQLWGFDDKDGKHLYQMDFLSDLYDMFRSVVENETQSEFINRMRFMGENNETKGIYEGSQPD